MVAQQAAESCSFVVGQAKFQGFFDDIAMTTSEDRASLGGIERVHQFRTTTKMTHTAQFQSLGPTFFKLFLRQLVSLHPREFFVTIKLQYCLSITKE